jgi:Methyltransferase domain
VSNRLSRIRASFPIASQTSDCDKLFLLAGIDFVRARLAHYRYIEIGSFLGGSLPPFLMDSACLSVLSVDERGRLLSDERGAKYDYSMISQQHMVSNLSKANLDIRKLTMHDGPIDTFPRGGGKFDLAFVDVEHTDRACIRDFVWLYPMMNVDSIIIFHDSTILYRALAIIKEIMREREHSFVLFKDQKSEMSALLLGAFADVDYSSFFGLSEDWDLFQQRSEDAMLLSSVRHRARLNWTVEIVPPPVLKAF